MRFLVQNNTKKLFKITDNEDVSIELQKEWNRDGDMYLALTISTQKQEDAVRLDCEAMEITEIKD